MPEQDERRRSPRVPMAVQVEGADLGLGYTRDISVHGVYVEMRVRANVGVEADLTDRVVLRFVLPGLSRHIEVTGRIARVDRTGPDGPIGGIGVEFDKLAPADRDAITEYVENHLSS